MTVVINACPPVPTAGSGIRDQGTAKTHFPAVFGSGSRVPAPVHASLCFRGLACKAYEFEDAVVASKRRDQVDAADSRTDSLHQLVRDPDPFLPSIGGQAHAIAYPRWDGKPRQFVVEELRMPVADQRQHADQRRPGQPTHDALEAIESFRLIDRHRTDEIRTGGHLALQDSGLAIEIRGGQIERNTNGEPGRRADGIPRYVVPLIELLDQPDQAGWFDI